MLERLSASKRRLLSLAFAGSFAVIATSGVLLNLRASASAAPVAAAAVRTDLYQPNGAILKKGNDSIPEIALTFDDGPYPESAETILAALHEQGVKATFFVVGRRVQQQPDLLRRIVEEGHELGNHSFSHVRLPGMPIEAVRREIEGCDEAIANAVGVKTTLFRPPGMRYDAEIVAMLQQMGKTTVGWTNACKDFETESVKLDGTPKAVLASRILDKVGDGSILLLHNTRETAAILPEVLVQLRAAGYRFVTVSEMLAHLPEGTRR